MPIQGHIWSLFFIFVFPYTEANSILRLFLSSSILCDICGEVCQYGSVVAGSFSKDLSSSLQQVEIVGFVFNQHQMGRLTCKNTQQKKKRAVSVMLGFLYMSVCRGLLSHNLFKYLFFKIEPELRHQLLFRCSGTFKILVITFIIGNNFSYKLYACLTNFICL